MGNPVNDCDKFTEEITYLMSERGQQVIGNGIMMLNFDNTALRWKPAPGDGTIEEASLLTDIGTPWINIDDVKKTVEKRLKKLDAMEENDPAMTSSGGKDWLRRHREAMKGVMQQPAVASYYAKKKERVLERVKEEEYEKARKAAAAKDELEPTMSSQGF